MDTKKQSKQLIVFSCIDCGFNTQKKCNYKSHLTTVKHKRVTTDTVKPIIQFICKCGKEYKNRQGLYKHRKTCLFDVVALKQWCNENPDALVNNTDNNRLKDKIYLQTLQGDERSREKIINNIYKEIIVDKE